MSHEPAPLTQWLTDFADQAVVLPVWAAVTLLLSAQRRWSLAVLWFAAIAAVLGALAMAKSAAYGCAWLLPALDPDRLAVRSPSGHAASATVLYGSLAGLAALGDRRRTSAIALLCGVAAGVAVAVTRVRLGAHSPAEAVLGFAVGLCGAVLFACLLARQHDRRVPALALAAALFLIALQHGRHFTPEQMIQGSWSLLIRHWAPACVPP